MCGCGLGDCTILFMDLDSHECIQCAAQQQEILDEMIQTAHRMNCESFTVYVSAAKGVNFELQTQVSGKTRLEFLDHDNVSEEVRTCAKTREVVVRMDHTCNPMEKYRLCWSSNSTKVSQMKLWRKSRSWQDILRLSWSILYNKLYINIHQFWTTKHKWRYLQWVLWLMNREKMDKLNHYHIIMILNEAPFLMP